MRERESGLRSGCSGCAPWHPVHLVKRWRQWRRGSLVKFMWCMVNVVSHRLPSLRVNFAR